MRRDLPQWTADKLAAAGVDPANFGDPSEAWRRLFERFGRRATLVDRYELESAATAVEPDALPTAVRERLALEVIRASWPGFEWTGHKPASSDPVEIVPYDPRRTARFETLRARLADALGPTARRIDHVGSTAVPGLAAKPVIDVQVSVPDVEDEAAYVRAVESAGVVMRSRDALHRYFRSGPPGPREVQVHVCSAGSAWERDHLLFRDFLRAHPDEAAAYGRLKTEIAGRWRSDRLAYTDAKTDFILDAMDRANAWAARTGWAART